MAKKCVTCGSKKGAYSKLDSGFWICEDGHTTMIAKPQFVAAAFKARILLYSGKKNRDGEKIACTN